MSKPNGTHALSVGDRMALLGALPQEGSLATIRIVHELRMELALSQADHEKFEIKFLEDENGKRMVWNPTKAVAKEIEIGPVAHAIIVSSLKAMDKHEKLTTAHLGVYERFVEPAE